MNKLKTYFKRGKHRTWGSTKEKVNNLKDRAKQRFDKILETINSRDSLHKNTDCRDCHETRGPFHRLDSTFRGLKDVGVTGHKNGLGVDAKFEALAPSKLKNKKQRHS